MHNRQRETIAILVFIAANRKGETIAKHKPWECKNVTDIQKRKAILRESNRSYNCLQKSHSVKQCRSSFKCYICKQLHNTSICNSKHMDKSEHVENSNFSSTTSDIVLLKTASAEVTSIEYNNKEKCRILFDDCSQKTYITKELSDKLKLKPIAQKNVIINGTCAPSTMKSCDVVKLKVTTHLQTYFLKGLLYRKTNNGYLKEIISNFEF